MIAKKDGATTSNKTNERFKRELAVVSFVVTLFLLFWGIFVAVDYYKIRPYKKLATELNQTLGGGYKIFYKWHCGLDTPNCPSARMLKDMNFKDNDEAKALFGANIHAMQQSGYVTKGISFCEPRAGFPVYCSFDAKKDKKVITVNAKQDFIGIDIEP